MYADVWLCRNTNDLEIDMHTSEWSSKADYHVWLRPPFPSREFESLNIHEEADDNDKPNNNSSLSCVNGEDGLWVMFDKHKTSGYLFSTINRKQCNRIGWIFDVRLRGVIRKIDNKKFLFLP